MSEKTNNTSAVEETKDSASEEKMSAAENSSQNSEIAIIDEHTIRDKIYEVRGVKVMLDFELAEIYGYSTKRFNEQVKNNITKFDDDFRFQLTKEEADILRSKKSTSSWGGTRYLPWAFTESGIYMLMTVLKGNLATLQSKALIRTFRAMKDYIIENQGMIGKHEYLQLSLQVTDSVRETMKMRGELNELGDQMKAVLDKLCDVVTKSEIAPILLELGKPEEKREYLLLNGQPARADETYINIYSKAKKTVIIVDNYINIKTLRLLQDVQSRVAVTVFSDNLYNKLHANDYTDFQKEFPGITVSFQKTAGIMHDRFIVLDYETPDERMYHCGASSKDAGVNRTTAIAEFTSDAMRASMHSLIDQLKLNPPLILR